MDVENSETGRIRWLPPSERPFDPHDNRTWSEEYRQWRANGGVGYKEPNLIFVTNNEARADYRVFVTKDMEEADVKVGPRRLYPERSLRCRGA